MAFKNPRTKGVWVRSAPGTIHKGKLRGGAKPKRPLESHPGADRVWHMRRMG